jgi:predicted component of type VI protein secretion system
MITLRLFPQSDPAQELDSRPLADGELSVGRDAEADWVVLDPSRTLSRRHCVFSLADGVVTLRDESTNGVFLRSGERAPPGAAVQIDPGETVSLGDFLIRIDLDPADPAARAPTLARPATTLPVVSEAARAGKLLDAFCQGAQIDSSLLSGEDPTEVLRRVGAIYRAMVLGLGELMNERTRAKAQYGLEWTTVQAIDNNPFRWAPPMRVAVDLLQGRQDGFLASEAAVRSSFADLRDHQARLGAGARAALAAVLADLAPDAIARQAKGQSFLVKRAEVLWAEYARAHARASEELNGAVPRAFREAYRAGPAPDDRADEAALDRA